MVEKITLKEIEERLEQASDEARSIVLCRTALRALPALSGILKKDFEEQKAEDSLVAFFRCMIVGCVGVQGIGADASQAVSRARKIADRYYEWSKFLDDGQLNNAAFIASAIAAMAEVVSFPRSFFYPFSVYNEQDFPLWLEASDDFHSIDRGTTPKDLFKAPLWRHSQPETLISNQIELIQYLEDDEDLIFWARWYQSMASGHPPSWSMQAEIAAISDEDWAHGAEHVSKIIWQIEAKHLAEATPYAERLTLDADTGLITTIKASPQNAQLYQTTVNAISDSVQDIFEDGNLPQFAYALSPVIKRLERSLEKYTNDPQRFHDDLFLSARQIQRLVDVGEVPLEPVVDALLSATQVGAIDIRAADETVRASVEARVRLQLQEMDDDAPAVVEEAIEILLPVVDAELRQELEHDLEELHEIDDMLDVDDGKLFLRSFIVRRMIVRVAKLAFAGAFSISVAGSTYSLISEFVALATKRESWLVWREREFVGTVSHDTPQRTASTSTTLTENTDRRTSMEPITALGLLGSLASIISLIKSNTGRRPSVDEVVEEFERNASNPGSLENSINSQVSRSDVVAQAQKLMSLQGLEETVLVSIAQHCHPKILESAALPGGSAEQEEKRQEANKCICGAIKNYLKLNGGKFESEELKELWVSYECAG